MTATREIWNLSSLCRCCHIYGKYKSLDSPHFYDTGIEVYSELLRDTFNVVITMPLLGASYTICEDCIARLRDAAQFKKQVVACEAQFQEYCKNEMVTNCDSVKIEEDFDTGDVDENIGDHTGGDDYSSDTEYKMDVSENDVKCEVEQHINNVSISSDTIQEDKSLKKNEVKRKGGRPPKRKAGRPKTSELSRKEQLREATRRYKLKRPEAVRNAQKRFLDKKRLEAYIKKPTQTNIKEPTQTNFEVPSQLLVETTPKVKQELRVKKKIVSHSRKTNMKEPIQTNIEEPTEINVVEPTQTNIIELIQTKIEETSQIIVENTPKAKAGKLKPKITKKIVRRKPTTTARDVESKYDFSQLVLVKTDSGVIYSCKTCGGNYSDRKQIEKHITTNHTLPGSQYTCDICQKTYKVKYSLYLHIKSQHDEKLKYLVLRCRFCFKPFNNEIKLKSHIVTHTNLRKQKCELCSKVLSNKVSLKNHLLLHKGQKVRKHICYICGHGFNDATQMSKHIMAVHEKQRPYICDICQKTYTCKKHLKDHIHCHMGLSNTSKCKKCNNTFFKAHKCVFEKHEYKCTVCEKVFDLKKNYLRHVKRLHSGQRPYKCRYCPKDFYSRYNMLKHELLHSGIKPFACPLCDNKYSTKASVDRHMKGSHGPKDKQCDICNEFVSDLKRHTKDRHSEVRFPCEECEKCFSHKSALNRHKAFMHMGVRYKCTFCNKMYGSKRNLITHTFKNHGIDLKKLDIDHVLPSFVIENKNESG